MNKKMRVWKRIEGIGLCTCLLLFFLTGCGETAMQDGTNLELERDGGVTVTYIEDFPADYYDLDELIAMNQEEVDAYNAKAGEERVEIVSTQTDGSSVTLVMHYKDAADYTGMNGVFLYQGPVAQGQNSGVDLDHTFKDVNTGETILQMDWNDLQQNHLVAVTGATEEYKATVHTYKAILYATDNVTVSEDGKTAVIGGSKPAVIVFK